ncbi:MAG: UPF0158 family protein [Simkaniaceae bacterium]
MAKSNEKKEAKNPLILRFHRMLDAFSKSDDERDFYIDRQEGFIVFVDLDKNDEELLALEKEIQSHEGRYVLFPKMSYFETKKFMEGFVNEKVYDIDTKEKLLAIIAGKESRENFLEFIYDHVAEMERWQQYYHERSRIRIIGWLIEEEFDFVFEEDLEIQNSTIEKVKSHLFDTRASKEVSSARDAIKTKAKSYYSTEALNPRPKRGRPPKQQQKVEVEPELTQDIYQTVPSSLRPFLFMPDFSGESVTFSAKHDNETQFLASLKGTTAKVDTSLQVLSQRLESLRHLSERLRGTTDEKLLQGEEKLMQAISKREESEGEKVVEVAKGFLPKKRTSTSTDGKDIGERLGRKRKAGSKKVSEIKRKKKS